MATADRRQTLTLPPVIGHRGAAALAPENTLASVRAAVSAGANMVEVDVILTSDGEPIILHDETLDRTTNGSGAVVATPWSSVQRLDAGSWFAPQFAGEGVPHLDALLRLCLDLEVKVNLEIKPNPGQDRETTEAAIAAIRRLWPDAVAWPLLSSFSAAALAAARDLAPEIPRGLLMWDPIPDWNRLAKDLGCITVHARSDIGSALAADILSAGFGLATYTVNDPADGRRLMQIGVQSIITDDPGRILAAMTARHTAVVR